MRNGAKNAEDILKECQNLEAAGIHYHILYQVGHASNACGLRNASRSAAVFNQLHPVSIGDCSPSLCFLKANIALGVKRTTFTFLPLRDAVRSVQTQQSPREENVRALLCLLEAGAGYSALPSVSSLSRKISAMWSKAQRSIGRQAS